VYICPGTGGDIVVDNVADVGEVEATGDEVRAY